MAEAIKAVDTKIAIDKGQFDELVRVLGFMDAMRAAKTAVKKTLNNGKALFRKKVAPMLNVPRTHVLGDKSKPTITTWVNNNDASGLIIVNNTPLRAIKFKTVIPRTRTRQPPPVGVSAVFQTARGPLTFKRSFIGKLKYRQKQKDGSMLDLATVAVLRRHVKRDEPKVIGYRDSKRWPGRKLPIKSYWKIKQVYGPSLINLVGANVLTAIGKQVVDEIGVKLAKNLASQVDWLLDKRKRPVEESETE